MEEGGSGDGHRDYIMYPYLLPFLSFEDWSRVLSMHRDIRLLISRTTHPSSIAHYICTQAHLYFVQGLLDLAMSLTHECEA